MGIKFIYIKFRKWLHNKKISFEYRNPFNTWWKARKRFKFPHINWYIGRMQKPYTYHRKPESEPIEGLEDGMTLYKDTGYFYFVYYDYLAYYNWHGITVSSSDVQWKWKYDDIRYEHPAYFSIIFGKNVRHAFQICFWLTPPKIKNRFISKYADDNIKETSVINPEDYWEPMLWYTNGDKPGLQTAYDNSGIWTRYSKDESGNDIQVAVGPQINPDILTKKGRLELLDIMCQEQVDSFSEK